jgi:hypothetical protein
VLGDLGLALGTFLVGTPLSSMSEIRKAGR